MSNDLLLYRDLVSSWCDVALGDFFIFMIIVPATLHVFNSIRFGLYGWSPRDFETKFGVAVLHVVSDSMVANKWDRDRSLSYLRFLNSQLNRDLTDFIVVEGEK